MMRLLAFTAGLAVSCGLATSASALTGSPAVDALVGNTIVFTSGGIENVRYLKADGSMTTMVKGRDTGFRDKWAKSGNNLCMDVDVVHICYAVEVSGDDVSLQYLPPQGGKSEFPPQPAKLLKGNPRNLK